MTPEKKRVVIVQGSLADYRIPIFEGLAKSVDLTIIHSGPLVEGTNFAQISVPARSVFGIHFQHSLKKYVEALRPDAVVAMFDLRWPSFLALMKKKRKSRIVLWGHRYGRRKFVNFLRDRVIKCTDAVLLYGSEDVKELVRNGLSPQKIFFANNTIKVGNAEDCSNKSKDRFLFVGRLQKRKKLEKLLVAFSKAENEFNDDIRLEIIGDGDQYAHLMALAEQLNIKDRVDFSGAVYDEERLKLSFAKAFAYVSPGAVGLSVLHSFSYGVPVVTFRDEYHGPEFHNLIHAENSLILENEHELTAALTRLQTQSEFRKKIGRNASVHYQKERAPEDMIAGFLEAIGA